MEYLTAKVLEAQGDEPGPFTMGLINRTPVTDWELYHSGCERFVRTLELTEAGERRGSGRFQWSQVRVGSLEKAVGESGEGDGGNGDVRELGRVRMGT